MSWRRDDSHTRESGAIREGFTKRAEFGSGLDDLGKDARWQAKLFQHPLRPIELQRMQTLVVLPLVNSTDFDPHKHQCKKSGMSSRQSACASKPGFCALRASS